MRTIIPLLFLCFSLTGCLLPKAPGSFTIAKTQKLGTFGTKIYTINNERDTDRPSVPIKKPKRNLLYVALDESVAPQYSDVLSEAYNTNQEIRIEDVSWWRFAPKMRGLYNQVVHLNYKEFHRESFFEAIRYLEKQKLPYDIYLLTHGIPNHITTSKGYDLISYEDLEDITPEVKKLQFVFMQGCFSSTLVPDFHLLGAKEVLSYEGWNRNFFYVDYFIDYYKTYDYNVKRAFEKTNDKFPTKMKNSLLYKQVLKKLNMTLEEYLAVSPSPIYSNSK